MIAGVSFSKSGESNAWLCDISYISDEFKNIIRRNLSSICHGNYASCSGLNSHQYKSTIREFLTRYERKLESTKKGMVGEMLSQLILREYLPEYSIASPYFNQEERSIRKGFDIVAYKEGSDQIWLTEIKSGERNTNQSSNDKCDQLFTLARDDLFTRLNNNNSTLWYNAINSARSALSETSAKSAIISALDKINTEVTNNQFGSSNSNVFLIATIYSDSTSKVTLDRLNLKYTQLQQDDFNSVVIMSIQKEAFSHIVDFLESEL